MHPTYTVTGVRMDIFIKRLFYVAWQASVTLGMGRIQANPAATEADVWRNIWHAGDYPVRVTPAQPGVVNADYVFGKMMKLAVTFTETMFSVTHGEAPRYDYQSWALIYPNVDKLIDAVVKTFPAVTVLRQP